MSSNRRSNYRLVELAKKITKGTTPTTLGYSFVERGINFIKAESIQLDGSIDTSKFVYIDSETHEKLQRSQLEENDILFSMAGMVLGKVGIVRKEHLPANTNQALAIIRLKKELALPEFVAYFMRQESFFDYVNQSTGQSAQPNINLEQIGNLDIALPSFDTQKRIVNILSALDNKIELNHQINATLEALAQAIFKEWFMDFNFLDKRGEMVKSELGFIPSGWRVAKLGELCEKITKGTTPTTLGDKFVEQGVAFLRAECIQDELEIDSSKVLFITNETHKKLKRSQLAENDILITIAGSIGRVGIVTNGILPANINQAIGIIRVDPTRVPVTYIFYYLKQQRVRDELLSGITQSVQANISLNDLYNLNILVPPPDLSSRYNTIAVEIRRSIENLTTESVTLASLRDLLLPRFMNGEIEV